MYTILCDFDGTLVMDNGEIDPNYLDMLHSICNNNHLCLVSSSSFDTLTKFKNKYNLKLDIFSSSSNITEVDGEIRVNKISSVIINTLIEQFNRSIYTAYSEGSEDTLIYKFQDRLDLFYPKKHRLIINKVLSDRPSFTFVIANEARDKFVDKIRQLHLVFKSVAKDSNREIINVYVTPISKADGYYILLDKYKSDKVIGISDSIYDYDMFEKCDIKIAMRNGDYELKKRSDIITKYDNNNSGAIRALYDICHLK